MEMIDGNPRYRCVVCGEPTLVISRVTINKDGTQRAHPRNGSAVVGFRNTDPTYYTNKDGLLAVTRYRPEIIVGPACPLHEGRQA